MDEQKIYVDYVPATNPPADFPQLVLYADPDKKEKFSTPILVSSDGLQISFERVTQTTAGFVFDGLTINSATTEIPGLDWYVEQDGIHLKDLGSTGTGGITVYLYTLSVLTADGKKVYLDPQLVNTGGTGQG